jgi:hypothetical protein
MKVDWLTVTRDVLLILVVLFLIVAGLAYAVGGLDLNAAFGAGFLAMTIGFLASGCLSPKARFSHLPFVAVGVWLLGTILNTITRGFPIEAVWQMGLRSVLPVLGSMLLGGALSLAIVKTPESGVSAGGSAGDSNSSQA